MSVQTVTPAFSVDTICPIYIRPNDNIIVFQRAKSVSFPQQPTAGFTACVPDLHSYANLYNNEAKPCCFDLLTNRVS